jgi:hypothetical protein
MSQREILQFVFHFALINSCNANPEKSKNLFDMRFSGELSDQGPAGCCSLFEVTIQDIIR